MLSRFLNHSKKLKNGRSFYPFFWKKNSNNSEKLDKILPSVLETLSNLSVLAESLNETMRSVGPKFEQLGHDLQSLYTDTNELGQLTVNAARLIGDETEESFLNNVYRLARQCLEELQNCQAEISGKLQNVDASAECLEELYNMCALVEKIAISLNVVGLNIEAECNRSVESRERFTVFVQEIKQLARKVIEISQSIRKDSRTTRSNQIFSCGELSEQLGQLHKLTNDAEKTVENAVKKIKQLMSFSCEVLEKAGDHLQKISGQVGEIVVAIQFHDITQQQIEHIVSALQDLERPCSEKIASTDHNVNRMVVLGSAHSVLSLQVAQLKKVISEIDAVYQRCMCAFGEIDREVEMLVDKTSTLGLKDKEQSEIEDLFEALKSGLEYIHILLGKGHKLGYQMGETAEQASEAASKLSYYVDQVCSISGVELHIKSINAIVKTAHLGEEGRVLEVLAQEVMRLSSKSNELVAEVVEILGSITVTARELKRCSWKDEKEVRLSYDKPEASLCAVARQISMTYKQLREDSSMALERSQVLRAAISLTRSNLRFLPELIDQLTAHLNQLEKIVQLLDPWAAQAGNEEVRAEVDRLARKYTMMRERDVHDQVLTSRINCTGR